MGGPENGPGSLKLGQWGAREEVAGGAGKPLAWGRGGWGGEVGRGVRETPWVAEHLFSLTRRETVNAPATWALPALVFVVGASGSWWEHGRRQGLWGWLVAAPRAPSPASVGAPGPGGDGGRPGGNTGLGGDGGVRWLASHGGPGWDE